jgi:hypothetical protein
MSHWEKVLGRALVSADAGRALKKAAGDRPLPRPLRRALETIDEDGVRLAALLMARLRFERLLQGSDAVADWFEQDPADFARAFERYHREVPPTAFFPPGEAKLFTAWVRTRFRPRRGARATRRSTSSPPDPT